MKPKPKLMISPSATCAIPKLLSPIVDRPFNEVYRTGSRHGRRCWLYIFTGEHDADLMHNSATINLNMLDVLSASAGCSEYLLLIIGLPCTCAYNQEDPLNPQCAEHTAYPAAPDSEYGWEKLFSEAACTRPIGRNYGMRTFIRAVSQHLRTLGHMDWRSRKEHTGCDLSQGRDGCTSGDEIEVWGDGEQTRSFLYIEECL